MKSVSLMLFHDYPFGENNKSTEETQDLGTFQEGSWGLWFVTYLQPKQIVMWALHITKHVLTIWVSCFSLNCYERSSKIKVDINEKYFLL